MLLSKESAEFNKNHFILKNILRKINSNSEINEKISHKFSSRGSKTYPNSSDMESESFSQKEMICNIGSRSELFSSEEKSKEKDNSNKTSQRNAHLLQSDEMFKTISDRVGFQLDDYLHVNNLI